MRYTQYCGLAQATYQVRLKFAAMNLKKLALCKWAYHFRPFPCSSLMLKSRILYARIRLFRQAGISFFNSGFPHCANFD